MFFDFCIMVVTTHIFVEKRSVSHLNLDMNDK